MPDLLIELFSEEIPARMQTRAAEDLQKLVTGGLAEAGLTFGDASAFSTPRRLTLAISDVLAESEPVREERKGPKVGAPDQAIEGFLRGAGVAKEDLEIRDDKKGQVYFAVIEKPGRMAADIIAEVLEKTIRTFPWPKSMRWGEGNLKWVRPLHSIICLLGEKVVPLDIDGIVSGDFTYGHRFMSKGAISVASFVDYEAKLKQASVVLRAGDRADAIWAEATKQASVAGLEVVEDRGLLAEVAGLVEWPVVLMGRIDDEFLELPPEVLQTSMKEHQKFFSVRNAKTGRIEQFITVANMETADNGATILAGNQKVLSARLADAKFFWENDLRVATKEKMQRWLDAQANVTFHNKLGSQRDLIERMTALAKEIAPAVGADPELAAQAAQVAKADLASEMVYEFPDLQGLMGRYYSEAAGLPAEVAAACEGHYAPLGPSDDVPTAPVSVAVSLAEKLDKLTGFWAIDEKPTGSKDPFALRRAALGVIRTILSIETRVGLLEATLNPLRFSLIHANMAEQKKLNEQSAKKNKETAVKFTALAKHAEEIGNRLRFNAAAQPDEIKTLSDLLTFFHDRLKVFLRDQGIRHDIIDACIAMPGNDDLTLLVKRARALSETLSTDDGENLIQGFKRANNILTQAEEKDGVEYSYGADIKFAEDDAEKALFKALDEADATIKPAMEKEDFTTAMAAMAGLRGPIDAFFTDVQVNADSDILRRNRLNLLSRIRSTCLAVADLTKIEG